MAMRNGLYIATLSLATAVIPCVSAHGQTTGFGAATQYSVTMKSFDFCTDAACSAAVNVTTAEKIIDIASVSAGADAATYATASSPPLVRGQTYTHIRFKMSAVFTIKGSGTDGTNFCNTTSANNNTSTTTAKAAAQATSAAAAAAAATAQVMTIPLVGTFSSPTAADLASLGMTQVGNDLVVIRPLANSFTLGAIAPTFVVSFPTQDTILFIQTGPFSPCALVFPQPPKGTITPR